MQRPYKLSCHCRAIQFEVDAELEDLGECNCSTCGRYGVVHCKVLEKSVRLLTFGRSATTYLWRDAHGGWKFCPVCGAMLMLTGYPEDRVSVNARMIIGLDVFTLNIGRYDGRNKMLPGPETE